MDNSDLDRVIIVGGSIAGFSTGLFLYKNGIDSIIYEEHNEIGKPEQCSGLISLNAFNEIKRVTQISPINYIKTANFYFNERYAFSVRNENTKAVLIDRIELDKSLAETYQSIANGRIVHKRMHEKDLLKVKNKIIVGADGFSSTVARTFCFPNIPKNSFVKCLQYFVRLPFNHGKNDEVEIFFSRKLFPGFIGWFIPIDETYAKIGCGTTITNTSDLRKVINVLLNFYGADKRHVVNINGGIIPLKVRPITAKEFDRKYVFLVGDSAGQVKALSGGGIYFAHKCAEMLAQAISSNQERPEKAIEAYEKTWREEFDRDLKFYELSKLIFDKMPYGIILKCIKLFKLEEFFMRHGDMDRFSSAIKGEYVVSHFKRLVKL
ncbi:MAG: NAD(P)/FAD-dependent oxidoreductase [Candidatus Micrarchaeota archaeon]|nr:NAD(P)/FAD-dependent oxidoreductase [Candidatus Micrarchaeota archaeon]